MGEKQSFVKRLPVTRIKIFLARILYLLVTPFVGKNKKRIERNGVFFEVDLSEGIDLSLYLFGNFQSHVLGNQLFKIPEEGIIIDVGANFGIMALQLANTVKKGKVYAFEPTHYALGKLKRNLELNPQLAERIEIINSFVSSTDQQEAEITAYSSWKVSGEQELESKHPIHLGAAKSAKGVGSVTLTRFCNERNLSRLDFIKIDTDGHEFEVLKGGAEVIRKLRPVIVFEIGIYVMEEHDISFSSYDSFFTGLNYELIDTKTKRKTTAANYKDIIPYYGTTDLMALPLK